MIAIIIELKIPTRPALSVGGDVAVNAIAVASSRQTSHHIIFFCIGVFFLERSMKLVLGACVTCLKV